VILRHQQIDIRHEALILSLDPFKVRAAFDVLCA
jgi:hypothetical protein